MVHIELNLRERRTIEVMLSAKVTVREIAQSGDQAAQRRLVTGTDRGRLQFEGQPMRVSHETIYAHVLPFPLNRLLDTSS